MKEGSETVEKMQLRDRRSRAGVFLRADPEVYGLHVL